MRKHNRDALSDAVWNIGMALSLVFLSAGLSLRVAKGAAPSRAAPPNLPVTLDSCPLLELPLGSRLGPGTGWPPAYLASEVERPAGLLTDQVRAPSIDTTKLVLARFVIDTMGRAIDGTLDVMQIYEPRRQRLWELPAIVSKLRYRPAEQPQGRKVCQVVQQEIGLEVW